MNGVASNYATGYSGIVWFAVFGAFLLVAFKIKRKHYKDVFIVRRERRYIGFLSLTKSNVQTRPEMVDYLILSEFEQ